MSMNNWSRYFEEVSEFLRGAERQYGIANDAYTDYVLERLEICIHTCSTLLDHLQGGNLPHLEEEELPILDQHRTLLHDLVEALKTLWVKWQSYKEFLESGNLRRFSYEAGMEERTGRRGRPRFDISKEQLEYLASLSFTWTEIAVLLGISRMTVYRYVNLYVVCWSICDQVQDFGSVKFCLIT